MNSSTSSRLVTYRATLEFAFWACRELLKLALFAAIIGYCIVSLIEGDPPWLGGAVAVAARLAGR